MASQNAHADVVFMDPPRAGSDERFLSSVVKLSPKKVIYISCNPETLARDLKYLTKHHYKVEKIQPVDMFPFCDHCETVCELVRSVRFGEFATHLPPTKIKFRMAAIKLAVVSINVAE